MRRENLEDIQIGDWMFMNEDTYIAIRVPTERKNGELIIIPIAENVYKQKPWIWNGSKEAPTLTPSIKVGIDPVLWHGYLTDGKLITV